MLNVMLFLHVVGAVGMGVYAILPFVAGKFSKLSGTAQEGLASGLLTGGRVGQYALVLQLLTGGYLMTGTGVDYSTSWLIAAGVLFIAIGALSGIIQAPLKRIGTSAKDGQDASASITRVRTLSTVILILFIVILWVMQNTW
jgi:uncharacterized membrane protein